MDFDVIMSASHEDLIRLGVRTSGDIVRLRDTCRRVYKRSSTSISLEDKHRTSSNRPGREERALLFSPSVSSTGTGERRTGSQRRQSRANGISNNRKRKVDYTWTGQFMCLSDCHAKKYQHQQKNKCYRRRVWGLKKIKFSVEDDEVANQLTGTVESDETADYPQLKKCGGFELLRYIPNCKVLESTEVVMSAKILKAAAVKGNFTSLQYKDPYLLFP